ncbi:MAG: PolC-type DNA polymerase III [Ruminococcaceae bacterium]|nr:PolC-type DNA polymerase III [Oscillospiraceae bacterium]
MQIQFLEKFKRYVPSFDHERFLKNASVVELKIGRESKSIEVKVSFPALVPKDELYAIEDEIRTVYELSYMRIVPVYDSSLFTPDYLPEVIKESFRLGKVSKGFLDNCKTEVDGHEIRVTVPFSGGGVDLLYKAETPQVLTDIIKDEFSLSFAVSIIGSSEEEDSVRFTRLIREKEMDMLSKAPPPPPPVHRHSGSEDAVGAGAQTSAPQGEVFPRAVSVYDDDCLFEVGENEVAIGRWHFDISSPETVFGEEFEISPIPIRNIRSASGNAVIVGKAFLYDERPTKKGDKTGVTFAVSDGDNSIYAKMYLPTDEAFPIKKAIGKGGYVALFGALKKDKFDNEIYISPASLCKIKRIARTDKAEEKRVELHVHTNLSTMDAIIKPEELVETAFNMGHPAVAITDHGTLQAYPIAMAKAEDLAKANPDRNFKVLYGIEAYYVDDTARAVYGESDQKFTGTFVVFDIETTGLSAMTDKITEIGAVKITNGEVVDRFLTYCDPEMSIPPNIVELTGITDEMVKGAPKTKEAVSDFLAFIGNDILVAHNANFDVGFIRKACEDHRLPFENTYIDTVVMSRYVNPDLKRHKLDVIAKYYQFEEFNHHRAIADAEMLAKIFVRMGEKLSKEGVFTIAEMGNAMGERADPLKLRTNHMILLVKNKIGLKNLYKIMSEGELKYFYKHPRLPKSLLTNLREGLIIGSACEAGELFTALLGGKSEQELKSIASFYDYLEIQPLSNNAFMLDKGLVKDVEELKNLNRRIVELGEKMGKPVVATTDAHFLNEEDEIYRQILLHGQEFPDYGRKSSLYFRTTDEMLKEFSYLGEEKAYEVVVKNPRLIADMIEPVRPIPKGTYTPNIEGSDEELQTICYNTAKEIYGDPLPEIVEKRLEKELASIIKNGFAVLYIIAQKLVYKSVSLGYSVGSRGSVGSSFVATMAGISEVNPLPPHYVCPSCKHSEFITDGSCGSGFDLPDKTCPLCGAKYRSDGHDIPFETFLGFYGDKSPDIDLNFSGDVQAVAHKYTEELFGAENVFRAGTLTTLAEKTAYGYVMKYLESRKISLPKAEVERLKDGCVGVKRTTGQHPGGIIVVPAEYDVYEFTPIQHPPKDTNIITTHFPFVYLHDTILKLDILGHDVPTKLKMFEKYTGIGFADIPMNDRKVYELFQSTEPLGVTEQQIGAKVGTYGLPEFGTRFIQQVLLDAKPKNFADLLQISGLTHGTDVWLGNAKDLIDQGICDISQVVGTRDGIMLDLIRYGVENKTSFDVMEDVRKGNRKGLIYQHEQMLKEHGVPDWYIASCKKIKYMFPKAHAAAYVMSAIRLGWYKIYHPVAFYAGFFTVVPDGMDAEIITQPMDVLNGIMKELEAKGVKATQNEQKQLTALQLVRECRSRGIELLPVSFLKSDGKAFLPEGNNIRIPFSALPGLGENAAEKIIAEREKGIVHSVEDLQQCAKLSKSLMTLLEKNGVFEGMPMTNQITLF